MGVNENDIMYIVCIVRVHEVCIFVMDHLRANAISASSSRHPVRSSRMGNQCEGDTLVLRKQMINKYAFMLQDLYYFMMLFLNRSMRLVMPQV
jgi:hypothetical protein